MPEELKNYLSLERFPICHKFYAFLDSENYQADGLFIKYRVRVKFLQEYAKEKSPYCIIFCQIRKRDEAAFLYALRELPNKMLLCGYPDYPAQCRQFMIKFETAKKERSACA